MFPVYCGTHRSFSVYCFTCLTVLFSYYFFFSLSAEYIPVLLDGIVLGGILPKDAPEIVAQLRYLKAASNNCGLHAQGSSTSSTDINTVTVLSKNKLLLDPTMEVAYIPRLPYDCAYPGVYLFTQAGRMIRPVLQLGTHYVEWIGPMEVSKYCNFCNCSIGLCLQLEAFFNMPLCSLYHIFSTFSSSIHNRANSTASVYGDCLSEDRHPPRRNHPH